MTNYEVSGFSQVIVLSDDTPSCFPCFQCNQCMSGKRFFWKDGHKYCVKCFSQNFVLKCALCKKAIQGMSSLNFIFYENRIWHDRCFKCSNCGKILGTSSSKDGYRLKCTRCGAHLTWENNR